MFMSNVVQVVHQFLIDPAGLMGGRTGWLVWGEGRARPSSRGESRILLGNDEIFPDVTTHKFTTYSTSRLAWYLQLSLKTLLYFPFDLKVLFVSQDVILYIS